MPFTWKILIGIMRPFFQRAEKGAETGLYIATSEELEKTSGRYFKNLKEIPSTRTSYDAEMAKLLWEVSEQMTTTSKVIERQKV